MSCSLIEQYKWKFQSVIDNKNASHTKVNLLQTHTPTQTSIAYNI